MAGHAAPHAPGEVQQQVEQVKQQVKQAAGARGSTRLLSFFLLANSRVKQGPTAGRELLAAERGAFQTRSTDLPFLLKKKIGRM